MNTIPEDVFFICCSFLLPRDLIRTQTLSKEYNQIISTFLKRSFQTTTLKELICHMCGNDWKSQQEIYPNDYFDIDEDLHYFETIERQQFITDHLYDYTRKHLLCNDCEIEFQETSTLSHFKYGDSLQLWFNLYCNYPWVILIDHEKRTWYQYNSVIPANIYDDEEEYDYIEEQRYLYNDYMEMIED